MKKFKLFFVIFLLLSVLSISACAKKTPFLVIEDVTIDVSNSITFNVTTRIDNYNKQTEYGVLFKKGYYESIDPKSDYTLVNLSSIDETGYFNSVSSEIVKDNYLDYYTFIPYLVNDGETVYGNPFYQNVYFACEQIAAREDYTKDRIVEKILDYVDSYIYMTINLNASKGYLKDISNFEPTCKAKISYYEINDDLTATFLFDKKTGEFDHNLYLKSFNNYYKVSTSDDFDFVLSMNEVVSNFDSHKAWMYFDEIKYACIVDDYIYLYNYNVASPNGEVKYASTTLPEIDLESCLFNGWLNNDEYSETVKEGETYIADLALIKKDNNLNEIIANVSDYCASNTIDTLPLSDSEATYTWVSSNDSLYHIDENGNATISKEYQNHKEQTVTVSVKAKYNTGEVASMTKEITIGPVLYNEVKDTPIATYFSTGALYAYKKANPRYLADKTLFSEDTKETLDILYYSFIYINEDGTCYFGDPTYIDELKELKNYDVRICASVAGQGDSGVWFANITKDDDKTRNLANNLLDLIDKYGIDGLDIDWESTYQQTTIASGLTRLAKILREEMDKRQADKGTPYLLTMALAGSSWAMASDRIDCKGLNKYLDYVNIMSYDMNNSEKTTHLAPVYSSSNDKGYGFGVDYAVKNFIKLGMDASKLIIGCASYGKGYKITGTVNSKATYVGLGLAGTLGALNFTGCFGSGTVYGSGIEEILNSGKYKQYDEYNSSKKFVGSYLYCATDNTFVTFDSTKAITEKYNYAKQYPGMGLMVWSYSEDIYDRVMDALTENVKNNK